MKLRNRGINGSWRKGARRTFRATVYTAIILFMTVFWLYTLYQHSVGVVDFRAYRAVSLFFIGTIFATVADPPSIEYTIAWITDDEDIAY